MPKLVGSPKTGGRTKGTPNRRTLHLSNHLQEIGFDPVEHIVDQLPQLNPLERVHACLKMMEFQFPKRKPVDAAESVESVEENVKLDKRTTEEQLEEIRRLLPVLVRCKKDYAKTVLGFIRRHHPDLLLETEQ